MIIGTIDKIWEEIHSTQEWGQYPSESVIRFVARNFYKVPDRSKVRILDVGVGGGSHTWYLAREGFDTYGFDGSPSAVQKTEMRLTCDGLKAKLICATGQEVEYENDFFDAIIDSFCIYANMLDDILLIYKKLYAFMKEGGKIFTTAFGKKSTGYMGGRKLEEDTYTDITEGNFVNRGTTHFCTKENFVSLLESCGFKNIKCETNLYTDNGSIAEIFIAVAEK